MGRTLPTQVQILRGEEDAWRSFRRALRKEDQVAFDDVWAYARRHSTAASMASRPFPFEAHVLSMIVGLKREIQDLKEGYTVLVRERNSVIRQNTMPSCPPVRHQSGPEVMGPLAGGPRGPLAPPDGDLA